MKVVQYQLFTWGSAVEWNWKPFMNSKHLGNEHLNVHLSDTRCLIIKPVSQYDSRDRQYYILYLWILLIRRTILVYESILFRSLTCKDKDAGISYVLSTLMSPCYVLFQCSISSILQCLNFQPYQTRIMSTPLFWYFE